MTVSATHDRTADRAAASAVTAQRVWRYLDKASFAVLSHVTSSGRPRGTASGRSAVRVLARTLSATAAHRTERSSDETLVGTTVAPDVGREAQAQKKPTTATQRARYTIKTSRRLEAITTEATGTHRHGASRYHDGGD